MGWRGDAEGRKRDSLPLPIAFPKEEGRGWKQSLPSQQPSSEAPGGVGGWGWGTHRVGLSAGGLTPEVGGNDRNEELQDGEDGKHGQIAPAHILGTTPTVKASPGLYGRKGPRGTVTCPRSHSQAGRAGAGAGAGARPPAVRPVPSPSLRGAAPPCPQAWEWGHGVYAPMGSVGTDKLRPGPGLTLASPPPPGCGSPMLSTPGGGRGGV